MGELDGIEATRLITDAHPDTKVILVSTYEPRRPPGHGARASGAVGYVNKDELSPRVVRRLWETGGDPAWLGTSDVGADRRDACRSPNARDASRLSPGVGACR